MSPKTEFPKFLQISSLLMTICFDKFDQLPVLYLERFPLGHILNQKKERTLISIWITFQSKVGLLSLYKRILGPPIRRPRMGSTSNKMVLEKIICIKVSGVIKLGKKVNLEY